MKVTTYFEVSADAGLAYDTETGEPSSCYSQVSTDGYRDNLTDDEVEKVHAFHIGMVCRQFKFPEEYLRRITEEEYNRESEGGDDE